ncbi:P-type Ca(2+) transporter [Ascochyta rabiei]|uniref:Calcium-transporting ATPase n=1 Tax=Didymella rabiei TaxID=5454 RepID=A0A163I938_DIDRA|nr:P-type Ca(2+) transporter [Ascochyta rabiei]KZM25653.1 ATP binding [Ascochyta rabiei]UPX12745.1 P-type Ca(2+) transporter [Ascochyta rabiei]
MESGKLAPPTLQVNTRQRALSNTDTISSATSDPFRTPVSPLSDISPSNASTAVQDPESALRPDPGTEADFAVDNNPFAFSPGQLNKLLNPKSLPAFQALGGVQGIAHGLQSDTHSGLSIDEAAALQRVTFDQAVYGTSVDKKVEQAHIGGQPFEDRKRVYGRNVLPPKKATPLWRLIWNAYNDTVLIVLTVAAAISLALGLYETFGAEHPPGSPTPVDWVEGLAICIAIIIVVLVTAVNDWQKEQAFVRLNAKKEEREIKVTRSGKATMISVYDVLAGDIIHMEPGDVVPVDGIFIEGHDVRCDESSATGESDAIRKTPGAMVMKALENGQSHKGLDPFIISGAKVNEGVGTYITTSVGVHSSFGKIMMSVRTDMEATPLQEKLGGLAVAISKIGSAAAGILFFILLFRFIGGLSGDTRTPSAKGSAFMDILIVAVTIIVVAVPEGLPLAVTLALAFATTRMLKENNLVRVLRACETMGNATAICSDKTGTLTTNKMTVVAGRFGSASFAQSDTEANSSISSWASNVAPAAKELLVQSIAINSTAFEGEEEGRQVFIGSKTETALLQLAKDHLGLTSLSEARDNEEIVYMMPFDSSKKCMAAVVKLKTGGYRLVAKGASEILLKMCSEQASFATLQTEPLSEDGRQVVLSTIGEFANKSLRTIGLVYQEYTQWPPANASFTETGSIDFTSILRNLVFFGIVGIQDPVRPGVPEAVRKAQGAGVTVRMVTGDNMQTARAIATECNIYTEGGVVMEGPEFRRLSESEMDEVIPRLQVLARSSPEDKRVLVVRLKALGEIVAVTGDGTNDAPALKAANIGFSMGISGTEVAKEASAIILMDDNFASIITALMWGRAVNDAVQKFLQFQITVNITAVLLAFVTAVYDDEMKPALKAVQLLWVNLIMDTFAALALATDPPTERILNRLPQGRDKPLITTTMWKQITGQNIYKLTVIFVLYFAGGDILGYDLSDPNKKLELDTVIFNSFVWMQIFNIFNNRRLDNKLNIFEGIHRNHFFTFIVVLIIGLQVMIIFVGGRAFQIKPGGIDGTQWAISIITGFICIPWAVAIRYFPDRWFAAIAHVVGTPVVIVYRWIGKGFSKIGGLFRKKKTEDAEKDVAVVTPPIVVVVVDDVMTSEKGKSQV